jgi:hypothetical protein
VKPDFASIPEPSNRRPRLLVGLDIRPGIQLTDPGDHIFHMTTYLFLSSWGNIVAEIRHNVRDVDREIGKENAQCNVQQRRRSFILAVSSFVVRFHRPYMGVALRFMSA